MLTTDWDLLRTKSGTGGPEIRVATYFRSIF